MAEFSRLNLVLLFLWLLLKARNQSLKRPLKKIFRKYAVNFCNLKSGSTLCSEVDYFQDVSVYVHISLCICIYEYFLYMYNCIKVWQWIFFCHNYYMKKIKKLWKIYLSLYLKGKLIHLFCLIVFPNNLLSYRLMAKCQSSGADILCVG